MIYFIGPFDYIPGGGISIEWRSKFRGWRIPCAANFVVTRGGVGPMTPANPPPSWARFTVYFEHWPPRVEWASSRRQVVGEP